MTRKPYSQLTHQEKKERLAFYEKQQKSRGTTETLARIIEQPIIRDIKNGNKQALIKLALYDKESKNTKPVTASAFIEQGKNHLELFYSKLQPEQLVSVELKENNGYLNIYRMMNRDYADPRKQQNRKQPQQKTAIDKQDPQEESPLEL